MARMGQGRGVHRVLVGKPEGKRPMGRPRRRWEANIKVLLFYFNFIFHVPLLVVTLHAFFHIYNYCTMFINTYNYCYTLRWFGFFIVASNFVKRKCVYKF